MNKDRVEGKMKDVAGRVERQAGEWADDPKMQVKGTAKQAEGKAQNAVGKAEDATKKAVKNAQDNARDNEDVELREERARG
jgi:uncharacterized protein YjbJ (UPF0337 family)